MWDLLNLIRLHFCTPWIFFYEYIVLVYYLNACKKYRYKNLTAPPSVQTSLEVVFSPTSSEQRNIVCSWYFLNECIFTTSYLSLDMCVCLQNISMGWSAYYCIKKKVIKKWNILKFGNQHEWNIDNNNWIVSRTYLLFIYYS